MAERRSDSVPLSQFLKEGPRQMEWVREQMTSGYCPGCGGPLDDLCFPVVMSMWCGMKNHHIVPTDDSGVSS